MELKDLKFGYVVELRDGTFGMIAESQDRPIIIDKDKVYIPLINYKDNFENKYNKGIDIMKVYGYNFYECFALKISKDDRELLWERKEKRKMTVSEICKELGYDVEIIKED